MGMLENYQRFEIEAKEAIKSHESLKLTEHEGSPCLEGELLLSSHGILIDKYTIRIIPTTIYPSNFPHVYEIGGRIIPNIDWHFYSDGHCCLKAPPEEIIICRKGINLLSFIDSIVVPYFFNQKHRETFGYFLTERPHGNKGIAHSLSEIVGSSDLNTLHKVLSFAKERQRVERTDTCFCGSGKKFRHCHKKAISDLVLLSDNELNYFLNVLISTLARTDRN